MTTITLDQLTHEVTAIERALARIHRELARLHPIQTQRPASTSTPITDYIASLQLPVADWETMEREIYGE